jgi:hypothetical protein
MVDIFAERMKVLAKKTFIQVPRNFTGGSPHTPLKFDLAMNSIPIVKLMLSHGFPRRVFLKCFVEDVYQQDNLECVPCSNAAMMSLRRKIVRGDWIKFNVTECYEGLGGLGHSGLYARDVLDFSQKRGMRHLRSSWRFRIGSYAWAQPFRDEGVLAMKAAIACNLPVCVALFMPDDYNEEEHPTGPENGDCNADTILGLFYHQVCLVGYCENRFYFVDSQGPGWGAGGFGSFKLDVLKKNGDQEFFAYAYTATDEIDDSLEQLVWKWGPPTGH